MVQALIGNVPAGGIFAMLQRAGMAGGVGVAILDGILYVGGAIVAAVAVVKAALGI
ncbi:hypothetical protein GGR52DRAFT_566995 [Hypoxylon sp. FL1284]|nr:hypothetical protein GGR52DRAFT_566995 [Hypoxylon sp. FL1284]